MKIAVTGANSSVGQNLLARLSVEADIRVVAGVRSEQAFAALPQSARITPRVINYDNSGGLRSSLQGSDCVVHLAGILIESKHSNYAGANVAATAAVISAARRAGVKHFIFISAVGAGADSNNAYFRSKGAAERIVTQSGLSATIIRTPILLGPGTAGADSLRAVASKSKIRVLDGGSYTQRPLDIDDLNKAILKICQTQPEGVTIHELVGPEPIRYRDLIQCAAEIMGGRVEIGKVPVWIARLGAAITSTLKGGGITPTVIDVITMNEEVAVNADAALGISLTPLRQTLEKFLTKK